AFVFQAEDGIRDLIVMEFRRVLFRSDLLVGDVADEDVAERVLLLAPDRATRLTPEELLPLERSEPLEDGTTLELRQGGECARPRSEERRVGKECRARRAWCRWRQTRR